MSYLILDDVKNVIEYSMKLQKIGFIGGNKKQMQLSNQLLQSKTTKTKYMKFLHDWFRIQIKNSYPVYKKWKDLGRPIDKYWKNRRELLNWLMFGGSNGYFWVSHTFNSYYYKNKDKVKLQQQNYRSKNREKIHLRNQRYYKKTKQSKS